MKINFEIFLFWYLRDNSTSVATMPVTDKMGLFVQSRRPYIENESVGGEGGSWLKFMCVNRLWINSITHQD